MNSCTRHVGVKTSFAQPGAVYPQIMMQQIMQQYMTPGHPACLSAMPPQLHPNAAAPAMSGGGAAVPNDAYQKYFEVRLAALQRAVETAAGVEQSQQQDASSISDASSDTFGIPRSVNGDSVPPSPLSEFRH